MAAVLACPSCRAALTPEQSGTRRCPRCGATYRRDGGIWGLMAEGRQDAFREFVAQYETVRAAEGRRVQRRDHLQALPYRDVSRKRAYEWAVRSRSFRSLLRGVVQPLERGAREPLRILDLGGGLGWLAYRLALRGHQVAAVDLVTNDFDGLGVHRHYDCAFSSLLAEFDRLPLCDRSIALVIYNASFHYAADYASTLGEALRVLRPRGRIVIMDSPIYRDPSSGAQMVQERENDFERRYGFRGNTLHSEGYLTYDRLAALERQLGLRWEFIEPWYGLRWWLKPRIARLRGSREPARFKLVVGRPLGECGKE
jgi:SAM-dependent methyltransferase